MILTIKHRFAYYKRFELDVWGTCKTQGALLENVGSFADRVSWKLRKEIEASLRLCNVPIMKAYYGVSIKRRIYMLFLKLFMRRSELMRARRTRYIYRIDVIKPLPRKKPFKKSFYLCD